MKNIIIFLLLILSMSVFSQTKHYKILKRCKNHKISKVELNKNAHELTLWCENRNNVSYIIRRFPVMLSKQSIGKKRMEGDQKIPEGRYRLNWKVKKSKYYRSIHVSYPNKQDRKYAKQHGIKNIGGDIMIHGMPNKIGATNHFFRNIISYGMRFTDWTSGCIALQNKHMKEVWDLVTIPVPFIIHP